MTREEEIQVESHRALNKELVPDNNHIAFEKGFCIGAKYVDQHPRKGLWDSEKVIEWLDHYADSYTYFSPDKQETGFIGQMFDDLRKVMED